MFKLFNKYPVSELLRKVQWNARAMFIAYAFFIGAGVVGAVFMVNGILAELWIVMFAAVMTAALLMLVAPFLLYDYFSHKCEKSSLFTQDKSSLELWDAKIRESERIGDRLGVSDKYVFSMRSTFYIPCFFSSDAIKAIYSRRRHRKGRLIFDPNIYVICQNNELYKLPMGGKLIRERGGLAVRKDAQALDEWILSRMGVHMPHVLSGIHYGRSLQRFKRSN